MHRETSSNLTRRYLCAIGLLSLLALLAVLGMKWNHERHRAVSDLVMACGELEIRSHQAADIALRLTTVTEPMRRSALRVRLTRTADRIDEALKAATRADARGTSLYRLGPRAVGAIHDLAADSRALAAAPDGDLTLESPHLARILAAEEGDLFGELENATIRNRDLYEKELRRQSRLAGWVLAGFLGLLLAIGLFVLRPVLERLRREMERLSEGKADLEERVEVRTRKLAETSERMRAETAGRELAEAELRQKEAELRQSQRMEAIGRLAGGIAHDFNNLLTAIRGYGDCVQRDLGAGHPLADDLAEIRKAADRAATLTRQLLAFGRRQVLVPRVLDLNDVIAGLTRPLCGVIGEEIELVKVLGREAAWVKADPGQLERVILNLAVNAREAMPGGGRLTIETSTEEIDCDGGPHPQGLDPGAYVVCTVTDTGCGMDEVTRSLIFDPFFTTKEQGKGSGMGLAAVYGIISQSGGAIRCLSEPGRGTRFEIHLPSVAAPKPPERASLPGPGSPGGSETILIVEDEEMVRSLVVRILGRRGYHLLEASDGAAALQLSDDYTGTIDLLLTDIVMPIMSGPELVEQFAPRRPEAKVIFMSGYAEGDAFEEGLPESGATFIQKPFAPNDLADKVRAVLDGAEERSPSPVSSEETTGPS